MELNEMFEIFDKDGDGRISSKELSNALLSCGLPAADDEVKKIIRAKEAAKRLDPTVKIDIDREEFVQILGRKIKEATSESEIREAFRLFDGDNKGYLTEKSLKQVLLNMGEKVNDAEVDEMIRMGDVDEDGKISYHEFLAMMSTPMPLFKAEPAVHD